MTGLGKNFYPIQFLSPYYFVKQGSLGVTICNILLPANDGWKKRDLMQKPKEDI